MSNIEFLKKFVAAKPSEKKEVFKSFYETVVSEKPVSQSSSQSSVSQSVSSQSKSSQSSSQSTSPASQYLSSFDPVTRFAIVDPNSLLSFIMRATGQDVVGFDVAGLPVTSSEVIAEAKKAPSVLTYSGAIEYAKQQLLAPSTPVSPPVESPYKKYGYDIGADEHSEYREIESKLTTAKEAGVESLRSWYSFREDYPRMYNEYKVAKERYEAGLSYLSSLSDDARVWVDLNRNLRQESEEIMSKEEAVKRYKEQWVVKEGEYAGLTYDEYMGVMKGYYERAPGVISGLRRELTNVEYLSKVLPLYEKAGYKIDVSDEGIGFSLPSYREVHESLYPGLLGGSRLVAGALMESFPFIVPIRPVVSAVGGLFTGGKSWDVYMESLYEKSVVTTMTVAEREKGLAGFVEHAGRFWSPLSESGVGVNIYLPLATMGLGYAYSAIQSGTRGVIVEGGRVASSLSRFGASSIGKGFYQVSQVGFAGFAGASIGYSAGVISSLPAEKAWVAAGGMVQGMAQAIGGFALGRMLFVRGYTPVVDPVSGKVTVFERGYSEGIIRGNAADKLDFVDRRIVEVIAPARRGFLVYRFSGSGVGKDVLIGEDLHVSDYLGYLSRRGRVVGLTEGYNISKSLGRSSSGVDISFDRGGSALYGRYPGVSSQRGFSFFRPVYEPSSGNLRLVGENVSLGLLESKSVRGVYLSTGKVGVSSSLEGFDVIPGDIGKLYSLRGLNELKSALVSFEKQVVKPSTVSSVVSKVDYSLSYSIGGLFYLYGENKVYDIVYKSLRYPVIVNINIGRDMFSIPVFGIVKDMRSDIGNKDIRSDIGGFVKIDKSDKVIDVDVLGLVDTVSSDLLIDKINRQQISDLKQISLSDNILLSGSLFDTALLSRPIGVSNVFSVPSIFGSLPGISGHGTDIGVYSRRSGKKKRKRRTYTFDIFKLDEYGGEI